MEEIIQAGVEDCIYSGDICFIEWPEKIPEFLNENTVKVFIEIMGDTSRQVKIEMPTAS
jgi:tRNA threonylcarbamoyladenosine biosynthesis protein TsaE